MDPVVRRVIDAVLLDGTDDFVLLDSLLWHARVEAEKESRDYREAVAEVGFTLVDAGLAVIGDLDDGVVPWAGTAQQVAKRLTSQCEELGWQPMGGGCRLQNTPAGDAWAGRVDLRG